MTLNYSEMARIFRALASLLHGGLSLADGAYLLAREEKALSPLLRDLGQQLDQGRDLSLAMKESGAFPAMAWAMVSVGEETGRVEEALGFLAEFCEERCRTRRLLRQSLAYPCLILALMLGVIGVLLVKVLPVFDQVYASLGSGLTGIAGGLLTLGQWLEGALPALPVLLGVVLALAALYRWCAPFRKGIRDLYQKHWGDRGIARRFHNARFARALAMGIGSGLNTEEALTLAGQLLSDSPGAAERCRYAAELVRGGMDLAQALQEAELLPPSRGGLLAVGLRSGSADRMLEDVAQWMEEDARQALEDRVSRVEPAMVLLCSALVGLILLSVMVPLLEIMGTLG